MIRLVFLMLALLVQPAFAAMPPQGDALRCAAIYGRTAEAFEAAGYLSTIDVTRMMATRLIETHVAGSAAVQQAAYARALADTPATTWPVPADHAAALDACMAAFPG